MRKEININVLEEMVNNGAKVGVISIDNSKLSIATSSCFIINGTKFVSLEQYMTYMKDRHQG